MVPADKFQKRLDKTFAEDKARILQSLARSGCDNSPKGFVDAPCIPLMELLNSHADYVTTSSCSGRIAVFHSQLQSSQSAPVKRGTNSALGWLYVTHDIIADDDIPRVVRSLSSVAADETAAACCEANEDEAIHQAPVGVSPNFTVPDELPGVVSLKCEPFVMHVQCRTMDAAKLLLTAAVSDAGFRNSGVTPPGARIMVAIRHAGLGMDAPLCMDGCRLISSPTGEDFLRRMIVECNAKLEENFRRIDKLFHAVQAKIIITPAAASTSAVVDLAAQLARQ